MELYQLRYFSYAAKCENISEASRRLMVAQSSVSKAITGLEAELQTNLFIRNGKHIRLSSNGRLFAAKVAPILSAVDALPETFASEKENAVRLRVLSASALLPDILARFRQIEPQTRFHLLQSAGSEETDLTIFSSPDEVADMGTVFLTREEIMLAIPVSSPLSLHKEAELELLGREPIVMPTEDQLLREQIERLCTASGFKLEVDFECDSPFLVRMLVQRGLGITFWPVQTWRVYSSDSLTFLPFRQPQIYRNVYMRANPARQPHPALERFMRYLVRYFTAIPEASP